MRGRAIIFLVLLLFPVVNALPVVEFSHTDIRAGETVIATISLEGDNVSFYEQIGDDKVKFLEGRKEIFMEYDIIFYEGKHYLSLYTTRAGEFTLNIDQVLFEEAGVLKAHTLNYEFNLTEATVQEGNLSITEALSVRPGVWLSSKQPVIKLINKGEKVLNLTIPGVEEVVSLSAAETYEWSFLPEETFSLPIVSSYRDFSLPVVYISDLEGNSSTIKKESELKFDPTLLFANIVIGKPQELVLQLFNFAEENFTEVSIAVGNVSFLEFSEEELSTLAARKTLNLTVRVDPQISGNLQGNVEFWYTHKGQQQVSVLPYSFFVLPSGSNESDFEVEAASCEVVEGKQCPEDCEGKGVFIEGGTFCCLGQCKPYDLSGNLDSDSSSDSGGSGLLIGIIILIILAGLGFYFWRRSKKVGKQKPEEQIKQAANKYQQPAPTNTNPTKVSGGVKRV